MICAYCGKEAKGTKEHIISSGILDLFPECFATIDGERNIIHTADPMVKDVCAECNNHRISYIDSYAKQFIETYFLKSYEKDEKLVITYDYCKIQKVFLKYAFNDLRSRKKDFSFFTRDVIDFLLNEEESTPKAYVSVLAGLAVNTSPVPDFVFGNNKIRWSDTPFLCENSIVENIDYETGAVRLREDIHPQKLEHLLLSYVFRINSIQILLFCWEPNISDDELRQNKILLECQYPYTLLNDIGRSELARCTSESTYHHEKLIDVSWGQNLCDEMSYMQGTFSEPYQAYLKSVNDAWKDEETRLEAEHKR